MIKKEKEVFFGLAFHEVVEKSFKPEIKFRWLKSKTGGPVFMSAREASVVIETVLKDKHFKAGHLYGAIIREKEKLFKPDFISEKELLSYKKIEGYLSGRAFLPGELEKLIYDFSKKKNNWMFFDRESLQKLFLYFCVEVLPSVSREIPGYNWSDFRRVSSRSIFINLVKNLLSNASEPWCNRCLSRDIIERECPRCRQQCFTCRECLKMGEARSCTPLFLFPSPGDRSDNTSDKAFVSSGVLPRLDFELTPAQKDAYDSAQWFVSRFEKKALIFALCGGGKTEAVYGAISSALDKNQKILFAAPRRSIVKELVPRLDKAFPGVGIRAFYGGIKNQEIKIQESSREVIVCTTHQLYRFYRSFDLVILDEADAFPYRGSKNLPLLLERALKRGGKLIYISATPEKTLLKEARQKKTYLITIPARFHRKPAPLPHLLKISRDKLEGKNGRFHRNIIEFLERGLNEKKPLLIFVPTVAMAVNTAERLREAFIDKSISSAVISHSHSRDPARDEKLEDFILGYIKIIVSTSILERGITLKGVRVLVLFSHHDIFDERALVQMAGRSGRASEDPVGEVIFAGEYITPAMKRARRLIKFLNEEAYRKGYLDD